MMATTKQNQEIFELTSTEWQKICEFCERGQQIIKPSSFGYHRRRLTVENNDTLSWQTKSIPLHSIHRLTIGNLPKKQIFRKMDSSKAILWVTIDAKDRSLSLLYHDISSRNFWIKALSIYMSRLSKPLYIKSMDELQSALKLNQDSFSNNYSTAQIHYAHNGDVKPVVLPSNTPKNNANNPISSHIDIPNIEHEVITEEIDATPTPNASNPSTPNDSTNKKFDDQQKFNQAEDVEIVENVEDSTKSKETSNSTESMNVDYTSILEHRQQDIFRNAASSTYNRATFDAVSVKSTDDRDSFSPRGSIISLNGIGDTFNSTYFNTLSSTQQYQSLSHPLSLLIDVEEIDYIPDIDEIKNNLQKLYILTNNNGKIKNCDQLQNVCIINITLLLPSNNEEMNIQMIETEVDEIYSKLYGSTQQSLQCIVLPKWNMFAMDLKESCPTIFEYLQQKMEWLIQQIKTKNDQYFAKTTHSLKPTQVISPTFNDNTANSLSLRTQTLPTNDSISTIKPNPIIIPSNKSQTAKLMSNQPNVQKTKSKKQRKFSKSYTLSQEIAPSPIPKKLLHSLGVDPLSKLTITLMRNGEKFKMYYECGSSIICKVYLNSSNNGLIGDDLAISFSNIIALYAGKYDKYPNANPSGSFMIEYMLDDVGSTKCILLEIISEHKYLARRNWWINSIISCIANNKPFRVPPSISSISKILSAVTDDTKLFKLTFVDINDIEDTFSTSISFDTMDNSNDISMDTDTARKKALERVRKYKKLQRDIQNMTIKSKTKMQNKINKISKSIDIDTIPFDNDTANNQEIKTPNNLIPIQLENENKIKQEQDDIFKEEIAVICMDMKSDKNIDNKIVNENIDENQNENEEKMNNSIQFASGEDAAKMRSTILNLTRKLQYMEKLQTTQAIKMQKFVEKESNVIKRYEIEIKRLRKENKSLEQNNKELQLKTNDAKQQKMEIEKELKLQQWQKSKSDQNKHKKLKDVMSRMTHDMEILYDKLEKAENGYNAAVTNYNRESKQKDKLQKEYTNLEKRYVCDTQQIKDDLLELTQKNNDIKRHSKKLRYSLSHSEENENKLHELLKNEIERSNGLELQIENLYKQLNAAKQYEKKLEITQKKLQSKQNESEKISETFEAFNIINQQNQHLMQENKSLKIKIKELQNVYQDKEVKLNQSKQEINKLNIEIESLSNKIKEKEKIYQNKLIEFTQYAQKQMNAQKQMLIDKINSK